jgi:hypothetical protein
VLRIERRGKQKGSILVLDAAKAKAADATSLDVVADRGYFNSEKILACEEAVSSPRC